MKKDPYVYPGTSVLVNRLNLEEERKLEELENRFAYFSIYKLLRNSFEIQNINDIFRIHHFLFSDVYPFAGEKRRIDISKSEPILQGLSVEYVRYRKLDECIKVLNVVFSKIAWKDLNKELFVKEILAIITELWKIHPFREGNTRSIMMFTVLFLKQHGFTTNQNLFLEKSNDFRNAFVLAALGEYAEPEHLSYILRRIIV